MTTDDFVAPAGRAYLIEEDVGITTFIDPTLPSFKGIIKHRYSDFLVNEIDPSGKILRLEKAPEEEKEVLDQEEAYTELKAYLSDETIEKLRALFSSAESDGVEPVLTEAIEDKGARGMVHKTIRKYFGHSFISDGRVEGNNKLIVRWKKFGDKVGRGKPKVDWKQIGSDYLEFVVYKENRETMAVINMIARASKTSSKAYTFAGTKDKRGITVQRMTAYRVAKESLSELGDSVPLVRVGNFKYVHDRAKLGDLKGNHFCITLREVQRIGDVAEGENLEDIISLSMSSLRDKGFINYYGMQRFGTRNISTHAVGVAMLAGRWDMAVELILMPKAGEQADFCAAREHWMKNRDAAAALRMFPNQCIAERAVLLSLSKQIPPFDYLKALQCVPRNLRLMYVHAVQSYFWNKMASHRISLYGLRVVPGDLVALPSAAPIRDSAAGDDDVDPDDPAAVEEGRLERMIEVKLVESEEEAARWDVTDVVLPLPGHSIMYPTHEVGRLYVEEMGKYGLHPNEMKRKNRETSLTGDYRRVVQKPTDVAWRTIRYNDTNLPLTLTDLDRINGVPQPVSVPDGKFLGLVCEFSLTSSSYATMALREVLHVDTSAGFQTVLSVASKADAAAVEEAAPAAAGEGELEAAL
ncbi:pseudouridine synthase [Zopfochytrium polystomum]|nr:pseudouridine synthase [Zopfochytrium polystomum]